MESGHRRRAAPYGVTVNGPRVTIRDVARDAGVSVTTVSHALNGKGKVNAKTAERVRELALQLGYRPSPAARALRRGSSGAIALILPQEIREVAQRIVGLEYYMQVASTAAAVTFEHDRPLILPPALGVAADWESIVPDGVLLCDPVENDPHIDMLESMGVPVVTIERDSGRPDWQFYVAGDNAANTREVLDHLKAAGARRIALLATDWARAWSADIDAVYLDWCREQSQDSLRVTVPMQFDQRDAREAAGLLLDSANPPDAFYAPAESYSAGVARACAERGLRIPEDILLVCGIDGRQVRESIPTITAVDLCPADQTRAAIELLLARIDGTEPEAPVIVPSVLRVRASTTRLQER